MATVYLAEDLKHHRKVAVKVLHPELAAVLGAERFLAEIRTTANLQHPHILPLHDSGQADGLLFYVMPYVEGETLRARLEREQQLPIDDAVRITREVASALDYAHRHGVIHRDIKPENILLHEGQALIADFGIALAVSSAGGQRMTQTGMSLGTPEYMSPEQALGERTVTPKSDIYALGCVLYEMLTGEPPFTGATVQAIVAKVTHERPVPPGTIRDTVPPQVEAAVLKALAKVPADRFTMAAQFADALVAGAATSGAGVTRRQRSWAVWIRDPRSAVALVLAATGILWGGTVRLLAPGGEAGEEVLSLSITLPDSIRDVTVQPFRSDVALSPDDGWIAFGGSRGDKDVLFLHRLDQFGVSEIPGGGRSPFFSPDSRTLGFVRGSPSGAPELWRTDVDHISPVRIGRLDASSWNICGITWGPDGNIVVCTTQALWGAAALRGDLRIVLAADTSKREQVTGISQLPDGRVLFMLRDGTGTSSVGWTDMRGERHLLTDSADCFGWYARGWLVGPASRQSQELQGRRFDPSRLRCVGDPVATPLTLSLALPKSVTGEPQAALSAVGSLAWLSTAPARRQLVWVTRTGGEEPLPAFAPSGTLRWPRLAGDGRRLAVGGLNNRMEVFDLRTGARTKISDSLATEPVWLPDGSAVVTSTGTHPNQGLVVRPADGRRAPPPFLRAEYETWPTSVSPDGDVLVFYGASGADNDLYAMNLRSGESQRVPLPGDQRGARFSPDGRWIAYQTNASGPFQVVVTPWPALDTEYPVSTDGGTEPIWAADGKEIFFRNGQRIMAARVLPGSGFPTAPVVQLFEGPYLHDAFGDQSWDLASDGRFLLMKPLEPIRLEVRMVKNFVGTLRHTIEPNP